MLPSSSNVIMAAERACELSEKPARVVAATSQQASLLALVELDPGATASRERRAARAALDGVATGGVAPAARDDRPGTLQAGRRGRLRRRRDRRLGRRRLDPDGDDPAPRRGGRDRHRDRRRRGTDPARRRSTPTCPTGSRSRPTRGASRAGGGCSRPSSDALLRRRSRAEPCRAARRPRPLAAPERPRCLPWRPSTGVGPKLAAAAAEAGIRTVGDLLHRFPHSHRDRQCSPCRARRRARPPPSWSRSLAPKPRPFRAAASRSSAVKVGDESGHVRATWFNQPWVADKLNPGARLLLTGKLSKRLRGKRVGDRVCRGRAGGGSENGQTCPPAGLFPGSPPALRLELRPGPSRDRGPAPPAHARLGGAGVPLGAQRDRGPARPSCAPAAAWPAPARRSAPLTFPTARRRRRKRGAGSPSKSCSSTRPFWRRASASTARARPAPRLGDPGEPVGRWVDSLPFEPTDDQLRGLRRDRRRPRLGRADAAAADGGGRLRQDGGRRLRDAAGARSRLPGGADGADRDARRAARDHPRATAGRRGDSVRAADRRDAGAATPARRWTSLASGELGLIVGTHALIEPTVGVRPPRPLRGRRAAPLRGRAAPRARLEGGRGDGARTSST